MTACLAVPLPARTAPAKRRYAAAPSAFRLGHGRTAPTAPSSTRQMAVPKAAARGAFILFEGVDRCGKTTQSTKLVESLKLPASTPSCGRYPDRTTRIGQDDQRVPPVLLDMDDGAIHLLFSANRWEKRAAMEKALGDGVTLVVDRYSYSGVAFTAAKEVPGLDLEWCKAPERGLLRPDAVLYLDMPVDAAKTRGGFGEERYETGELQERVRENFRSLREDWWTVVDASGTIDDVHARCAAVAKRSRASVPNGRRVARLWD